VKDEKSILMTRTICLCSAVLDDSRKCPLSDDAERC